MAQVNFLCPRCAAELEAEEGSAAIRVQCPHCSHGFRFEPPDLAPGEWPIGKVLFDDYEVEGELGRGAFGVVYKVKSRTNGRQFAVKRTISLEDMHQSLFLDELQTWIDIPEHPHVVACRFCRTDGNNILVFADYIDGGTLKERIERRLLLTLVQILDVAIQFAWGLQAVHARVHPSGREAG